MKAPFWYVVKHNGGGYLGPFVDKHVEHQRDAGRHLTRSEAAKRAAWWSDTDHRVVRVWARLPKPRLPQWVDRHPRDGAQIEVWRHQKSVWRRYAFWVDNNRDPAVAAAFGDVGMWLGRVEVYQRRGVTEYTNVDTAPPDVWIEAGLRAAAMLRKANR